MTTPSTPPPCRHRCGRPADPPYGACIACLDRAINYKRCEDPKVIEKVIALLDYDDTPAARAS